MSSPYRSVDDPDLASFERSILEDIRDHGYHVIAVATDGSAPAWAYSVGLGATFEHPELVVFGLGVDLMHRMISNAASEIRRGHVFKDHSQSSEIVDGYDCSFREVHMNWHAAFMGYAQWFYRGDAFGCLQCFWPDRHHRFPWDNGFDVDRILQPLLYEPDRARALTDPWIVAQTDT